MLGEKLDSEYTNQKFKTSVIRFINDLIRMIFIVIIAIILEFGFIMGYWMISWIIDSELVDTIVYFCISAFFFGFTFYDFALERYQIGVLGSLGFAFSNPLSVLLTGSIFLALYYIPIAGIPISPVIAVMVSTIVYLYITKKLPINKTKLINDKNE